MPNYTLECNIKNYWKLLFGKKRLMKKFQISSHKKANKFTYNGNNRQQNKNNQIINLYGFFLDLWLVFVVSNGFNAMSLSSKFHLTTMLTGISS